MRSAWRGGRLAAQQASIQIFRSNRFRPSLENLDGGREHALKTSQCPCPWSMGQQGWASDASPLPTLSMRDALASGGLTRHWNSLVRRRRLYAYGFKEIALQKRTPRPAAQHGRRLAGAGCTPGPVQQLVTRLNVTYLESTPR